MAKTYRLAAGAAASVVPASPMPGVLVWMPLDTVGLGARVPALWVAGRLAPGDPVRTRLFLVGGALLTIVTIIAGIPIAKAYRTPPPGS